MGEVGGRWMSSWRRSCGLCEGWGFQLFLLSAPCNISFTQSFTAMSVLIGDIFFWSVRKYSYSTYHSVLFSRRSSRWPFARCYFRSASLTSLSDGPHFRSPKRLSLNCLWCHEAMIRLGDSHFSFLAWTATDGSLGGRARLITFEMWCPIDQIGACMRVVVYACVATKPLTLEFRGKSSRWIARWPHHRDL